MDKSKMEEDEDEEETKVNVEDACPALLDQIARYKEANADL